MTKEEILAMEPGRKMNSLIATKIMGWIPSKINWWLKPGGMNCPIEEADGWSYESETGVEYKGKRYRSISISRWDPSRDISDAWKVRDHIHGYIGGTELIKYREDPSELCVIHTGCNEKYKIRVWAPTMPEALCKAALIASLREGKLCLYGK